MTTPTVLATMPGVAETAPVVITHLTQGPLPPMATYIGVCCREWVLAAGIPVGSCGLCHVRPTYLRPDDRTVCHCGEPVAYGYDGNPTHHRGMCRACDAVRCDAYPGACREEAPAPARPCVHHGCACIWPESQGPGHCGCTDGPCCCCGAEPAT